MKDYKPRKTRKTRKLNYKIFFSVLSVSSVVKQFLFFSVSPCLRGERLRLRRREP